MEENRYLEEDFDSYLQELVDMDCLDDPAKGIAKYAIDNGYEKLSDKQKFVLKEQLIHYTTDECFRCENDIPWSEMTAAENNGGLCSWCDKVTEDRDDD